MRCPQQQCNLAQLVLGGSASCRSQTEWGAWQGQARRRRRDDVGVGRGAEGQVVVCQEAGAAAGQVVVA